MKRRAQALRRSDPVRRSPPEQEIIKTALECPSCGYENLHHGRVTIYDRREDEEWLTKTTVDNGVTVKRVRAHGSGNPSYRRHGLTIRFSCEHCSAEPELSVEQHKGATYLSWRNARQATLKS